MIFVPLLLLIPTISSYPQEFIAPVYELGGYVPPLPIGDVEPGRPSPLPAIDFENRIGDGEERPVAPPAFVLGSNPPISPIKPWAPSQIIPPGTPWPAATDDRKTTISPPGPGFPWPGVGNAQDDRITTTTVIADRFGESITGPPSISLEYNPMRPSFHPSPSYIPQLVPSGTPWPAVVREEDRIKDNQNVHSMGDVYAHNYNGYIPADQEPVIVLEYKPNRPFYAGQPKL